MDIISSVSSATVQADMNSSPYESSEHEQLVFKTPETPLNNALTLKTEKNDGPLLNSQISSPHSVHSNSPLSDPFISSTSSDINDFNVFSNGHNFSSFSSVSCAQTRISPIDSLENKTGLDQLLTCTVSTHMIPRMGSPQDSLISSPVNGSDTILSSPGGNNEMEPTNTEYTLIDQAGRFNINDGEPNQFEGVRFGQEPDHDFQQLLDYVVTDSDSCKVPKMRRDSDAPSSINKEDVTVDKLFEADLANSTAEFSFNKFGSEVQKGIFTFGGNKISGAETTSTSATLVVTSAISAPFEIPKTPEIKTNVTPVTRSTRGGRHLKEPSLCQQYSSRTDKYELRILEQPEEQHRARYLTEGSRGAIKNVSQEGNPVIKLFGDVDHATLQVFIGNDQGRVKPHAFYQACKVCGKNSTPCQEREIEGTVVIEMEMDTVNDKTCSIDNVGILKLRNADVENRVGIQKAKKKSTKARLIFRVQFQKPDGNVQILQVSSRSINCTQPIGQPEICKMSLREYSVNGNAELIMIGKNFMKGTRVFFQEISGEDGPVVWEKESEIDKDYFQPTHLVCTVPAYRDTCVTSKVNAQVVVRCSGKQSEPQTFAYTPVFQIKQETPMETDEHVQKQGPLNITVAPEALRLNQQLQESLASSSGKFMLPDGAVSGITSMQVDQTEDMEEKQSKESGTYQTITTSFNHQKDEENQQSVLSTAELQTSVQHQSEFQTVQSEECPFSMPKSSVENSGIKLDTSDLHSILKSLDEKPMTLHEILNQNPTETLNTRTGQSLNQGETSFSEGTSIGPDSASFSVANNNHQTVDLTKSNAGFALSHSANDVSTNQQTVSSSVFNSLSESGVVGFKKIVTDEALGSENFAANIQINQQSFQPSITSPTNFSEAGNRQNNQQSHLEFGNIQNNSQNIHEFGNNQVNPQSIQEFHSDMQTSQTQQIIVENIPAQSHIGHFQQHNTGNIQPQQNIGTLQSLQQNIGNIQPQQQSFGNIQQLGVGIIQQQNIGQIQQQQNNGQIQQQQQNIGQVQQQQSVDQIQQTNIGQIQQQQTIDQIQQQHNIGQIQQQNIGQIQQQNIGQIQQQNIDHIQQDIGQVQQQQQNIGHIQQDIGQVQQQQQNIGHIQQNIGQVQQQQQEFQVNFNSSQEMGNTFQPLQAYPSDVSNLQIQSPVTGNIQSKLTNDQVPVTVPTISNTTTEQIGYSDVAMRLLQQLLTSKSTDSSNTETNSFVNNAQGVNNTLYTTTATHQQASPSGVQANPFPQNLASPILQQSVASTPSPQPNVQKPSQGILHQMLSQDLEVKPPEFNSTTSAFVGSGQPAVQQLDSLRLQAMAQQVQQQAQLAQNTQPTPTPNGNPARGPQIIVLGGGSLSNQQTSQPNTNAAAAPSILILPGGGGDDNNTPSNPQSHVENILRAILGSLKPGSQ